MNILFLDLSSKSTGWTLANDSGELIKYGCITASNLNVLKRIEKMQLEISKLIVENNVEKIVAEEVHPEDYGFSHTFKVLMWLQGCIALGAYKANNHFNFDNIEFLQSSEWRKLLGIKTGRGIKREALKQADMDYIKQTYNIIANDDICDSLCLYTAYFKQKEKPKEYNWED